MALSDITDKILADARAQKDAIEAETRETIERMAQETATKKEQLKSASDEQLEREIQHRRERTRARAHQEKKRTLEKTKRSHIERAYDDAIKRLSTLERTKYAAMIASLAAELPPQTDGTVLVPSARAEETTAALKESGVNIPATPTDVITGGFIVRTEAAEYDLSIESLVHGARQTAELEVARSLFGTSE